MQGIFGLRELPQEPPVSLSVERPCFVHAVVGRPRTGESKPTPVAPDDAPLASLPGCESG